MKRLLAAGAAAIVASAWAGEAPIALEGEGAYHLLRIPLAVRAQARRADLGDLRVLNAQGVVVPHAWADPEREGPATQPHRQTVPLFRAPAAASAVEASQQGGWLIDLRGVRGAAEELQLSVAPRTNAIFPFVLEASDDLQRWQVLQPSAQLLALEHQGLRLEHSSFELPGTRGGYLRLRPLSGSALPSLTGAAVISRTQVTPRPEWQWSDPIAPSACDAEHCDYPLPRHMPLQRVEILLTEPNTLARVALLAQADAGESAQRSSSTRGEHRHLREPLRALRHKTAVQRDANSPLWDSLPGATVYALQLQGQALRSTVLTLPGGLYTQLRVQPQGGMAQLGASRPSIRVGAPARELVFLARGPAPYRLAWGQETPTVEMSLDQLMPGRRPEDPLPAGRASLAPAAPVALTAPASAASATPTPELVPSRKLWLWAALAGALAVMGFMAWSLLKPAKRQSTG